jgi:hypothetical protein
MAYECSYCVSGHYLSSRFYFKTQRFEDDYVSVFTWNLLSWAQLIELVPAGVRR